MTEQKMSDQLKQAVKQHIANMDDEENRVEKEFLEIDSDLREVRSNTDPNSELAEYLDKAIANLEGKGGIKNKVERLHKDMEGVENGNLDTTPKDMFNTIRSITDEAAGEGINEASLQTLKRVLERARGQANGEVAKEIERVEELVSDQFDTLLQLRQQIKPLI